MGKNKEIWRASLGFGLWFGGIMGALNALVGGLSQGIAYAVVAFLFSTVIAFIILKVAFRGISEPALAAGETLIHSGGASRRRGAISDGGFLYLTSLRLVFLPHAANTNGQEVQIALSNIASAKPSFNGLIIPNGLTVFQKDGTKHKFLVFERRKWAKIVNQALVPSQPPPQVKPEYQPVAK